MNPYLATITDGYVIPRISACQPLKLELGITGAIDLSAVFLQVHDAFTQPVSGAVPKKTWPAAQCAFKEFEINELDFQKGCIVAFSTTEATYTATDPGDVVVQMEFTQPEPAYTVASADDNTSLTVWASASSTTKRLYQVRILRNTATDLVAFLTIRAINGPTAVVIASQDISSMVAGEQRIFTFGGLLPRMTSGTTDCKGCAVRITTANWGTTAVATDTFDLFGDYLSV